MATHYQTLTVYNFEVETDHSYVANGLAVHNCPSCLVMHGTTHPVTDPGPLDHQQGRCSRLPVVGSWADLGFPGLTEPESALPDARAWFDGLPANQRAAIMGQARVDLLDTGRVAWTDLATMRDNPAWRPSVVPTPVRVLAG